jgi:plasmid stabilization system protein ParE
VIDATERLAVFPRSGRVIPEKGRDDLREVVVQGYRVFYRLVEDSVVILAIHHAARRFPDLP